MESQPQNPEFRINPENFTHVHEENLDPKLPIKHTVKTD